MKFPIRIPDGWKLTKSQGFSATHNGNDIVCGDAPSTFGVPVVWPFPFPGKPYDIEVNSPIAANVTKAHAQVDGVDPETGIAYSLIYIHLSGSLITVPMGSNSSKTFTQGETIGYIGNGGWVTPKPTVERPFDGSHLHLGLGVKKPGELNHTMVDPSLYFDINDPFRGPDDPSRDQVVLDWAASHGGAVPLPPPLKFQFNKNLWFGQNNTDVLELQKRLGIDYSTGPGNFGYRTLLGVINYQKSKNISPALGYVGPITRSVLNAT